MIKKMILFILILLNEYTTGYCKLQTVNNKQQNSKTGKSTQQRVKWLLLAFRS